jgi:hypothetical protein
MSLTETGVLVLCLTQLPLGFFLGWKAMQVRMTFNSITNMMNAGQPDMVKIPEDKRNPIGFGKAFDS